MIATSAYVAPRPSSTAASAAFASGSWGVTSTNNVAVVRHPAHRRATSEAVAGLAKLPFDFGVAHYDQAPPDQLVDIDLMHRADLFREANELKAWIEVEGGKIVDHGHSGGGRIGVTRLKLGPKRISVPAVAMPTLQGVDFEDGSVRFTQTAGGRTGAPAPRTVRGRPYFQWHSAIAPSHCSVSTANGSGSLQRKIGKCCMCSRLRAQAPNPSSSARAYDLYASRSSSGNQSRTPSRK